jgi:hypothetical protein
MVESIIVLVAAVVFLAILTASLTMHDDALTKGHYGDALLYLAFMVVLWGIEWAILWLFHLFHVINIGVIGL